MNVAWNTCQVEFTVTTGMELKVLSGRTPSDNMDKHGQQYNMEDLAGRTPSDNMNVIDSKKTQ